MSCADDVAKSGAHSQFPAVHPFSLTGATALLFRAAAILCSCIPSPLAFFGPTQLECRTIPPKIPERSRPLHQQQHCLHTERIVMQIVHVSVEKLDPLEQLQQRTAEQDMDVPTP